MQQSPIEGFLLGGEGNAKREGEEGSQPLETGAAEEGWGQGPRGVLKGYS